ncbi:conserved hypothetical protein [Methanococcus maripaludis C5]|uniref:Uncharacterized protein n=1 Tax=Methanococcus maripaludis (strain C5 / ATCC BAA-1333) TaxID=402880 RepID=A4FY57_METM5|nr:hypothetical protein [Methanococcus maripaludis]ABO35141.1 conserved hypothetical protein [Methanococcus maripaludis C5]
MDVETLIRRYFKKDISYMLFNVLLVMFLASVVLTVFHSLFCGIVPFLDDLTSEIQVLLRFFMGVSIIGIAIMELIIK